MFAGGRDFRQLLLSALVVVQHVVHDLDRVTLTQARVARAVVSKDLLALALAEPIVRGDRRPRLPAHARGDYFVIAVRLLPRVHARSWLGRGGWYVHGPYGCEIELRQA
jgi:hypothetical protein